jgi:trimethylamine:corrinoid methyltransferase-like protein
VKLANIGHRGLRGGPMPQHEEIGATLEERGLLMRQGTIVDATIIAAPSSTKNKQKARDPEMHQTRKGNQWHFGMPFDKLRSAYRGGCRLGAGPHAQG